MENTMNDTFNYVITEFNQATKTLKVEFEDGSWAQISLSNPLPTTRQELESIIAQYTNTMEQVQAIESTDTDLSFIDSIVGQQQVAQRRWINQPIDEVTSEDIDEMIATELGRNTSENQKKSQQSFARALALYNQNYSLTQGPLASVITQTTKDSLDAYLSQLVTIAIDSQRSIETDTEYTPDWPGLDITSL